MDKIPIFWQYLIGGVIFFFGVLIPLSYIMAGRQPSDFFTDIKKLFKKRR